MSQDNINIDRGTTRQQDRERSPLFQRLLSDSGDGRNEVQAAQNVRLDSCRAGVNQSVMFIFFAAFMIIVSAIAATVLF